MQREEEDVSGCLFWYSLGKQEDGDGKGEGRGEVRGEAGEAN